MADVSVPTTPTNPAADVVAVVEDLVERQRQILGALVATTHPLKNDVQAVLLGMRGVVTKLRNGAADNPTLSCPTPCDNDCDVPCHEGHQVPWKRDHEPTACVHGQTADLTGLAAREDTR